MHRGKGEYTPKGKKYNAPGRLVRMAYIGFRPIGRERAFGRKPDQGAHGHSKFIQNFFLFP